MSEVIVRKVDKSVINKHFFILTVGLLFFELICIYLNYIIDGKFIISLANKYSLTYTSLLASLTIVILIVSYILLLFYLKIVGKGIKFKNKKINNVNFIYYILLVLNTTFISILISNIFANNTNLEVGLLNPIGFVNSNSNTWIFPILFIIVYPFFEELIFRGYLLKNLTVYNSHFGIIVSAFLAALFHNNALEFLPALLVGYLLGRIAFRYDSYILTYAIKLFNNLIFYLLLFIDNQLIIILLIILFFLLMVVLFFSPKREKISRYHVLNVELYKLFVFNPLVFILLIISIISNFMIFYI